MLTGRLGKENAYRTHILANSTKLKTLKNAYPNFSNAYLKRLSQNAYLKRLSQTLIPNAYLRRLSENAHLKTLISNAHLKHLSQTLISKRLSQTLIPNAYLKRLSQTLMGHFSNAFPMLMKRLCQRGSLGNGYRAG